MVVFKFGGTSVGSAERMKQVVSIVLSGDQPRLVVLSAVSGTTNALVRLNQLSDEGAHDEAQSHLDALRRKYDQYLDDLFESPGEDKSNALDYVDRCFDQLSQSLKHKSPEVAKSVLAQGELISTHLFYHYLQSLDIEAELLPALEFMRIDKAGEPDEYFIKSMLQKELELRPAQLYITQGYICRNAFGEVDNLKRGGSDYTATLVGQALEAREIQIWTDIDGLHNNDPRIVEHTYPVHQLSYREAAELAYFGAKILHPSCVLPAEKGDIPIHLKSTMDPKAEGTVISQATSQHPIKAIAAKDGIIAIKITSGRMFNAYGFLKKVFEIFERHQTSIDMITTSEVAVSLTIDDEGRLSQILAELKILGEVEVDHGQCIICVVGHFSTDQVGYASRIFDALIDVPIRMISYGGSKYNVSILIHSNDKRRALQALNAGLFQV